VRAAIPTTKEELDQFHQDEFAVVFILNGDVTDRLGERVCGVELSTVKMVEADRPYVVSQVGAGVLEQWFDPGVFGLSVRVHAGDRQSAVRAAWELVRPAASFLGTYIRPPREGLDLQRSRLISPSSWVMLIHHDGWELASYNTWLLMTIAIGEDPGKVENQYNAQLFRRLVDASNAYWSQDTSGEDRLRIERSTTWYGRSISAGDYATMLLHGWMSIVPIVIGRKEHSDLMLERLSKIAARHGQALDDGFLKGLRAARNEIAHEASMANSDPLAVDAAQISHFLHPLRLLYVMCLLFVLEAPPINRPILEKWDDVDSYEPTEKIDDSSMPVWFAVPEIFGHMS